jgi:predicted nucleic acid-binding Zn ribbon protein
VTEAKGSSAGPPRRPGRGYPRGKRAPRTLGPQTASAAVAAALDLHGITDQVRAGRLVTEWTDMVGARIAQRTRPEGVVDRVLWVEVATSAWLHELNLLRPQLLASLRERLGEPDVFDELRFRLAGQRRRDPVGLRAPRRPAPPPTPAPPPATGAARERIVREAAAVDDDELRELIARVRITHDR